MKMNTLIVSGGTIKLSFFKSFISKNYFDNIIAVDKGLETLYKLNISPNHIVGDLDSIDKNIISKYNNNNHIIIHKYVPEKDYTDTDIALNLALALKSNTITIIGATGTRIDHSLSNIHILCSALSKSIPCTIIDYNNRIRLVDSNLSLNKKDVYGKYISLIPLTTTVEGLTLTGFKYPLTDYTLSIGKSLGISNELTNDIGIIELKKGILIVIESKD